MTVFALGQTSIAVLVMQENQPRKNMESCHLLFLQNYESLVQSYTIINHHFAYKCETNASHWIEALLSLLATILYHSRCLTFREEVDL
jgi:hypothetical protein